jgi:peptide/nickel transport system substrate-binding protein
MRKMLGRKILGGMALAALLAAASPMALAVERGGQMVFGRYADSLFLDPVLNDANVDIWILTNLYDTLLLPATDGKGVEPGLATAWAMADDGLSLTLTLREGVQFADGSPLTAEDVKWSLDRARKPDNGIWNSMVGSIAGVEVASPTSVVVKLSHPDPTIIAALATFNTAIMPEKLFEKEPGATDAEKAKSFAEHPIGTGPFVLKSWQRGNQMVMEKNPHYWQKGEDGQPLPYLDSVKFEIIPDDATRILKLQAGELGGAELIPYARVAELKADPRIDMELFPSTRVAYMTFNVRPELKDGTPNPLSDVKVRQALNYAVEKNGVIQITTHGVGTPMQTFMSSTTPLATLDGPLYPYDLAKAKSLLAESGFADGFPLSILVLAGRADEISDASTLQQMWAPLGVKLSLEQVDNATRTQRYREGDFQMRAGAWTNDINDPSQITSYFAYSKVIDALHSGWKNDEVDQLFEASQQEINEKKRADEYRRIQEIYNASAPITYLYETPYPVALQKNVKGFVQIPQGNNIFAATHIEKK